MKIWYLKYIQRLKINGVSKIVYSEVFNVEKSFTDDKIEVIHFVDGFMYAEKIKIYPWFNVAKIWEKSH